MSESKADEARRVAAQLKEWAAVNEYKLSDVQRANLSMSREDARQRLTELTSSLADELDALRAELASRDARIRELDGALSECCACPEWDGERTRLCGACAALRQPNTEREE